jgi:hypothetical protein
MKTFHPVGELPVDRDDQKVRCGLCGRWFRALGGHLGPAHGWSADDRSAFGLTAQRPLQAPAVSHAQAVALKRRVQTDRRLQAGMRKGVALARSGELNRLGRQADTRRGRALERRQRTVQQGARIGQVRAARFRAERDRRARRLGYADVADFLRQRYLAEGATVAELAAALECAEITVIAEMDRLGMHRRPQQVRLSQGRRALAAKRAEVRAEREARVHALGFDDLPSYLAARHHQQRWPRRLIAQELEVTAAAVVRLMRREGVPGLRGVKAAAARRPPEAKSSYTAFAGAPARRADRRKRRAVSGSVCLAGYGSAVRPRLLLLLLLLLDDGVSQNPPRGRAGIAPAPEAGRLSRP